MKRASISAIVMTILLLITAVDFTGSPIANTLDDGAGLVDEGFTEAGQPAYTGTGAARTATLKGMTNNITQILNLDSGGSATSRVLRPSGWTGTYLKSDIRGLRSWYYNVLKNGDFSASHDEVYTERGGTDVVSYPNYWRIHKYDPVGSTNDATWGELYFSVSSNVWTMNINDNPPDAGDYLSLSQTLNLPYMATEEVLITVTYQATRTTGSNQSYMFITVGTYQASDYCFESTDPSGVRVTRTYSVSGSYLSTLICPTSVKFEIGNKVKVGASGSYTVALSIIGVQIDVKVRPLPEKISLTGNSTSITDAVAGSTGASPFKVLLSQYVAGTSSRDGYNYDAQTFDLDGYNNDGHLSVAYYLANGGPGRMGIQIRMYVPKGAVITGAYLTITAADTTGTVYYPARILVDVADRANSTAFKQGGLGLLQNATWSNNPVVWEFASLTSGAKYTSPDISALLQRVVSNSSWVSGNYVMLSVSGAYFGGTQDGGFHIYGSATGVDSYVAYLSMSWLAPSSTTEQTKYAASGSWSTTNAVSLMFQTNATDVSFGSNMYLNATTTVSSLDNNNNIGTTFSVSNYSTTSWTANVLVSPPAGVGYTNLSLSKPSTWTLTSVTDADGSLRTSEATATTTEVRIKSSVLDVFGIWKFVLTTTSISALNLECGINGANYATTYTYSVGSSACFRGTTTYAANSAERLLLSAPNGQLFYAADDLTQDASNQFEWTGITVTSSWAAGLWSADVNFNNTQGAYPAITGRYSRTFTVVHATSLTLQSPVSQISTKTAGDQLYVEVKLTDTDNLALIGGATVTMNWTVSGSPTVKTLNDYGNGLYGKTLNTTDLGTAKRWRIDLSASKTYYTSSTTYFYLDLSHATYLTYQTPASTPYGDDFTVKLTLRDSFSKALLSGATVTTNGTLFGSPTDYGNGSYTVTLETAGLNVGDYIYRVTATPSSSYLLASNVSIRFTLRSIYTTSYGIGGSSASTPYSISTSKIITFNDTDHAFAGVAGASNSVQNPTGIVAAVSDSGGGKYTVSINVGTKTVGTYMINITLSKSNYYSSTIRISLTILPRSTSVVSKYTTPVPWGANSAFTVTWYDVDGGGVNISSAVAISTITVNGTSYGSSASFTYASSTLTVRSYILNVTVNSGNVNYRSSWEVVTLVVRAHFTTITAVVAVSTPWGFNTIVAVTFWDTDASAQVPLANVSAIQYTPSGYSVQTPATSYGPTLTTNTWGVGSVSTTITATCVLSNKFYSSATNSFTITIRAHRTSVNAVTVSSTPWGFNTAVTVTFWDSDTSSQVPIGNVSSIQYTPTGYSVQTPATSYSPTLSTSTWAVGSVSTAISVTCVNGNKYYDAATGSFVITIRAHHTTLSASAAGQIAWGFNTAVTVVFWDTDSNSQVPLVNVTTIQYDPTSPDYPVQTPTKSYTPTLTTNTWTVGTVIITMTVTAYLSNKFYDTASHTFSIVIRAHHTSVSVKGAMTAPYGNNTPLTVVFWDLDSSVQVNINNVTTTGISFNAGALGTQTFHTYTPTLVTSSWSVGTDSITLTVTCVETNKYYDTASYTFSIIIRSLGIYLYHDPTDLVFPSGDSFVIILRVNVSEPGNQYNGNPINGLTGTEFTVFNSTYTFPKTIVALGNGRYNLTISNAYLNMDAYTITVVVDPTSPNYATASLVISFSYRPARSYLSSPNYPHVTTPYGIDFVVTLNFTDVDRNKGITTANVSAQGLSVYGIQNLGAGIYRLTLNVAGLAKGDHQFNLTASAPQYETKKLTFTLTIRIAYTSAIPTVGTLDIPVGNSPVFYVRYWDTDRDQPVTGATMTSSWIRSLSATYVPAEQRYRIDFVTYDTDQLRQNYVVSFNFSKGENYQFGIFNITITVRTHSTEFRLVSAVEPTSYNGIINISLYYGDLDNNVGIQSRFVSHRVINSTGSVSSTLYNDTVLGAGFYIVRITASQFAGLGLRTFTVYFNWTGSVYKYFNRTLIASANIVGEDSKYTLITGSEPTPYLGNMTYTFFYAELYSGIGITNATLNVHVYVQFQGESIDLSKVRIWETSRGTYPGYYSIRFNTTLFGKTGLIYMNVYVNWSKGASPFYTNRTDTISVRILPRDTLVSVIPPSPTPWGQNATFSFTFDDVTGGGSKPIGYDAKMTISLNLASYTLTYNSTTKMFTVSFSTSQSPIGDSPLGSKSFTLDVKWAGTPFYANRTGRSISVTVIARQTVLDYQSPAPTPYLDNVTFVVTWSDVTDISPAGIIGATVTLYDGVTPVLATKYTVTSLGGGSYSIQLNTTYKTSPGFYSLRITLTKPQFYIPAADASRQFNIRYRVALLSSEPIDKVAYNSSIQVKVHYQDLLRLTDIGNVTPLTSIRILNGTGWLFTCSWQAAFGYYLLTIQTYNHPELQVGKLYTLRLNMSYVNQAPFYSWDDTYITFELRQRGSTLTTSAPSVTPYRDYANFTAIYEDVDAGGKGIGSASIVVKKGGVPLSLGTQYLAVEGPAGTWTISVNSTALDGLGTTQIVVYATWYGTPYHANKTQSVDITVIRRPTAVDVLVPPSLTRYRDNVVFTIAYTDLGRRYYIFGVSDKILILNGSAYLTSGQYTVTAGTSPGTFDVTINSTVLSARLVTDYQITVKVYWLSSVPYYANSTTIVRVTTTNRVGTLTWDPIGNTPLGDLMNLTFYYRDSDTGAGIANAIVQFDCVDKPGLQVGVDYTVVKGTGVNIGTYFVRVVTNRLLGIRTYTFTLTVLWNAAAVPYYSNQTPRSIVGTVRIISASLTAGLPTPSTVPYYEVVSIDVTFNDTDHLRPIIGVTKSNVTVVYLPGAQPKVWGFSELGGGKYRITVNVSDSGLAGLKSMKITFNWYPYTVLEQQVQFQVRYRNGALSVGSIPSAFYAGDPSYLILNLTDIDAGKPLAGATLAITWGSTSSWLYIGSGLYNVSFATTGMPAGSRTMEIQASKANYTIQLLLVDIFLRAIPMQIVIPSGLNGQSVKWGDSIVIHVLINDTLHRALVSGVTVTYFFDIYSGSMTPTTPSGNYSVTLDTSLVAWGTLAVQIRAEKNNYALAEAQIALNVERLPTSLTSDAYAIVLPRGSPWEFTVNFTDTYNDVLVPGATVQIFWIFEMGPRSDYMIALGDGRYHYQLPTYEAEVGSVYPVSIVATKANYQSASTSLQLAVTTTLTFTNPDAETATYVNETFFWSEIVRIGVWVTADLPETEPGYYREDVVVTWRTGGLSGTFTRDLSAPGHFDYWLNTSVLSAATYTLWITSSSTDPVYADSSTAITIVITRIPTLVSSPSSQQRYWGWKGTFVFNYTNPDTEAGIANVSYGHVVSATYSWADQGYSAIYLGNGSYAIYIDTTLVLPRTQPFQIRLEFFYDNYIPASGSFNLLVMEIPTSIVVSYSGAEYDSDNHVYLVPFGDDLSLVFFFNATVSKEETPLAGGIDGASWSEPEGSWLYPGYTLSMRANLTPLSGGNYGLTFRSADFRIQEDSYRLRINLYLANRTAGSSDLLIKIIPIPTELTIEGVQGDTISMSYGDTKSLTAVCYDNWALHTTDHVPRPGVSPGILGATAKARVGSSVLVISTTELGNGTYRLTIFADPGWIPVFLQENTISVLIELSAPNCANITKTITVVVVPTDLQKTLTTAVNYGFPIFFVAMTALLLWVRVYSVPKRLRQINAQIKALRKGRMPKPVAEAKSRQQLVTDLFNDTFAQMKLTRTVDQMPAESVGIEIPEMGELLVQLSMLTHLNQQELDDFKADISKMKMSEQAAFVREVINQEALRAARREGKTVQQVLEDLDVQATRKLGEERELEEAPEEVTEEPVILRREEEVVEKVPAPPAKVTPKPTRPVAEEVTPAGDKLSPFELSELKKQLEAKGVPAHEIDTIMEQAKQLPRDLVEELVKSITGGG